MEYTKENDLVKASAVANPSQDAANARFIAALFDDGTVSEEQIKQDIAFWRSQK